MTIDEIKELMETGEEFELKGFPKYIFRFDVNALKGKYDNGVEHDVVMLLKTLVEVTLIRKPWKPKVDYCYWFWISGIKPNEYNLTNKPFYAETTDLQRIAFGNCFRTKEECEKHTEIRDKLIEMRKEYV